MIDGNKPSQRQYDCQDKLNKYFLSEIICTSIRLYIHLSMAKKKMVSIRLRPELIEHIHEVKKEKQFTEYVEDALIKESKYKPHKRVAQ